VEDNDRAYMSYSHDAEKMFFGVGGADRMTITAGNVGINEASPAATLHLSETTDNSTGPEIRLQNTKGGGNGSDNDDAGTISFYAPDASGNDEAMATILSEVNLNTAGSTGGKISFKTLQNNSSTEIMSLNGWAGGSTGADESSITMSADYVGIGNSGTFDNPNSLGKVLEIAHNNQMGIVLNDTRDANPIGLENRGAVFYLTHGTTVLYVADGASGESTFYGDAYPQITIDGIDNGNDIGIKFEGPGGTSRGGMKWESSNNHVEILREDGTAAISIDETGQVGIGNAAVDPTSNLHVSQTSTSGTCGRFHRNLGSGSTDDVLLFVYDQNTGNDQHAMMAFQSSNTINTEIRSSIATLTNDVLRLQASGRSGNDGFNFLVTLTGGDGDYQHALRGNGETDADGAYSSTGADYAEYFESKDGDAIAIGTTVKLDGDKVVACGEGETPIGVVRPYGNSVVIGNSAPLRWQSKYLKDDYGAYILEEYTVTAWEPSEDEETEFRHIYHTDKIPSDLTVPDDADVVSKEDDGSKLMRRKENPDYDKSKTYTPRMKRDEWCLIGLLGQMPITKGQPTTSNWIKMKDISDTVEMYFVK